MTSEAFSDVRCTRCGGARLIKEGKIGVCSFIGCPDPLWDLRNLDPETRSVSNGQPEKSSDEPR